MGCIVVAKDAGVPTGKRSIQKEAVQGGSIVSRIIKRLAPGGRKSKREWR
jgi:hypothetical protein